MHSKTIESYKEKLKLTQAQREILIGVLLGDACLETLNHGRTYRLKIEQSLKHADYVNHLYEAFKEWVLTPPALKEKLRLGKHSVNVAFSTVSHGAFRFYAHQFYDGQKKCVPKLIHRWLTPLSMAYWYMDDGSLKAKQSKGVIFNTQGFLKADVERLLRTLASRFDLEAIVRRQKEGHQIYVSGHSFEKMSDLIKAHILPCMQYKFPKPRL